MGRRTTLEKVGVMARTKGTKEPSKAERIKKWTDAENARAKELADRKREVDVAMAAWQKAADKAQRDKGPDIPTKKPKVKKKPETPAERRARLKARDKRALGFK